MPSQLVLPEAQGTEERLSSFGFRFGKTSIHTSRTLMLVELSTLLAICSPDANKEDLYRAIIEDNLLGKTTVMARKLTAERLAGLYSLDAKVCVFRVMRHFWTIEEQGRPVLALLCALARDPLLRSSAERILLMHYEDQLICADMVTFLETQSPGRFSRVTFTSAAKNINSTWTQAGYLSGKVRKKRTQPTITPAAVTYALLLAYLEGARAQRLFDSYWVRLLDISKDKVHDLAIAASQNGWLNYRRAGEVIDIRFPDLLNAHEQELLSEQA